MSKNKTTQVNICIYYLLYELLKTLYTTKKNRNDPLLTRLGQVLWKMTMNQELQIETNKKINIKAPVLFIVDFSFVYVKILSCTRCLLDIFRLKLFLAAYRYQPKNI